MSKRIFRLFLIVTCLSIASLCVYYAIHHLAEPAYTLIEEGENYQVTQSEEGLFFYQIFDKSHNTVKSGEPLARQPHIDLIGNDLLRVTVQAGTGLATQWGFFYQIERDIFSNVFYCIYDQTDTLIATRDGLSIIIQDIFEQQKYNFSFSSFQQPLAESADPICSVEFIENGTKVRLCYLSGQDFHEVTEIIDLPAYNP